VGSPGGERAAECGRRHRERDEIGSGGETRAEFHTRLRSEPDIGLKLLEELPRRLRHQRSATQ